MQHSFSFTICLLANLFYYQYEGGTEIKYSFNFKSLKPHCEGEKGSDADMLDGKEADDDHSGAISFSPDKNELGWDEQKMRVRLFEAYAVKSLRRMCLSRAS